jgi:prevent-host-death family protein
MLPRPPRTVSASTFKAQCLALMDEVERTGEELLITKHGKVVARLAPVTDAPQSFLGWMAGTVTLADDLILPDPEDEGAWDEAP